MRACDTLVYYTLSRVHHEQLLNHLCAFQLLPKMKAPSHNQHLGNQLEEGKSRNIDSWPSPTKVVKVTKLTKSHLAVTKVVSATSMGVSAVRQRGKLFHGHLHNTPAKETCAGVWYMFDQLEPVGHRFQSTGWPTLKCCSHNLQSAPSLRPRPTLKKDKKTRIREQKIGLKRNTLSDTWYLKHVLGGGLQDQNHQVSSNQYYSHIYGIWRWH